MRILSKVFGLKIVKINTTRVRPFRHIMSPPNGTSADSQLDPDNGVVFTFGLIADVQYADIADGHDFSKTRQRYYRNAISQLSDAVRHWHARRDVAFVLQLGDLIDGQNRIHGESDAALKKTLDVCAQFDGPMCHIWGNHELYNYTKQELAESQLNSSRDHQETVILVVVVVVVV